MPALGEITADEIDRRSQRALAVPLLQFLNASLADGVDGAKSIDLPPSPNMSASVTKAIRALSIAEPRG